MSALVLTYAERLDLGDFAGVAALFSDATYRAVTPRGIVAQRGSAEVLATMEAVIRTYDGIPATKHVTTNLIVEIGVGGDPDRASCRSYFTVLQGLPGHGLQPVVAGRYHDEFGRGQDGWRFTDRLIYTDLIGDVSRHLQAGVLR
ncbi:MAG TPA: nuclear transport factor 2 family protein [Acidimicrobiales bacterium]|nr:nuclear transport factor 2 family protein [Acidimicrobiales bacterium]